MAKIVIEGIGEYYQHNPRIAVIVTARADAEENALAATWHMPISTNPPLYAVSIATKRFTHELIIRSREFGINFLSYENADLIAAVGGTAGRELDKFQAFNIAKVKPVKTKVPILEASYAAYECQLVDDREYADHHLIVGKIVATHQAKEAFAEDGTLNLAKTNPALYLGNELYTTTTRDKVKSLDRTALSKFKGG